VHWERLGRGGRGCRGCPLQGPALYILGSIGLMCETASIWETRQEVAFSGDLR